MVNKRHHPQMAFIQVCETLWFTRKNVIIHLPFKMYMGVSISGGSQNGWFRMEHPIKMDDLGGTPVLGTIIYFMVWCPSREKTWCGGLFSIPNLMPTALEWLEPRNAVYCNPSKTVGRLVAGVTCSSSIWLRILKDWDIFGSPQPSGPTNPTGFVDTGPILEAAARFGMLLG